MYLLCFTFSFLIIIVPIKSMQLYSSPVLEVVDSVVPNTYYLNHGMKIQGGVPTSFPIESLDHCLLLCLTRGDACMGISYSRDECLLQEHCGLGEERQGWITVFISTGFMKDLKLTNVAVGKKSYQQNTLQKFQIKSDPENANDGHFQGIHKRGVPHPCAHSEPMSNEPWWVVDMGTTYRVSGVRVWNRQDCCGEMLTDYSIEVSPTFTRDAPMGLWERCTSFTRTPQGRSETLCCENIVLGRYLKLQMAGSGKTLTLCEIEVFGELTAKDDCACHVLAMGTLPFKI
ncbi:unnamed protein product [Owenia fusiformis]|uniref:Uncharacterized protein n=1 Tax=Owenia fusiformis TaxID=6347 RepID=A0A8J1TBF0_OWEFU|nr:unnamed protein product [Owenia fusiformis]